MKLRPRGTKVEVEEITPHPLVRFHDLRHTAATLLLEKGTHAAFVAATLRHSKTSTTLDIYAHVTPWIMGAGTKAMETILSP